jgi:hypothetical protein
MLTLQDCLAMSGLDEDEVAAIAEHEHLPLIVAAELAHYLSATPAGDGAVERMIRDDIADALARDDLTHAAKLCLVLRHFCDKHPHAGR